MLKETKNIQTYKRIIKVLRHMGGKLEKELIKEYGKGKRRMYKRGVPKYNTWLRISKILNRMEKDIINNGYWFEKKPRIVTCNKCETVGYVNFDKGVDDAYCSYCGNWQKSREHSSLEEKK